MTKADDSVPRLTQDLLTNAMNLASKSQGVKPRKLPELDDILPKISKQDRDNATTEEPMQSTDAEQPVEEQEVVQVRTFRPPESQGPVDTSDLLGPSEPVSPGIGLPPRRISPVTSQTIARTLIDTAAQDRERKGTKKENVDTLWRDLLQEYESTRFVNIKLMRRRTNGEYAYRGARTTVDVNEVRNPGQIVPYRGKWVLGVQKATDRFDDEKTWKYFVFDRDGGPEPPDDWALDSPVAEALYLEVENMGAMDAETLAKLIRGIMAEENNKKERTPTLATGPGIEQPSYHQMWRPRRGDDEALEALRKEIAEEREARRRAELEAAEARRKAELETAEARRQADESRRQAEIETIRQQSQREASDLKTAIETSNKNFENTIRTLEARLADARNAPPPPNNNEGLMMAMQNMVNSMKDIMVSSRDREHEDKQHQLNERRMEMEKEKEERRLSAEKEREERRITAEREREDRRAEADRRKSEEERTATLYKMILDAQNKSSEVSVSMFDKINNQNPAFEALKVAADSTMNNMRFMASMAQHGLLGGGKDGGVDIKEMVVSGIGVIGNIIDGYMKKQESIARITAETAARTSRPIPLPQAPSFNSTPTPRASVVTPPPAQPPAPTQPPAPGPDPTPETGASQPKVIMKNPVNDMINYTNRAIASKRPAEEVADMMLAVIHAGEAFGKSMDEESSKKLEITMMSIRKDPAKFLIGAYAEKTQPDIEYLKEIANYLTETFREEDDDQDAIQPEDNAQTTSSVRLPDDNGSGDNDKPKPPKVTLPVAIPDAVQKEPAQT